MIEAWLIGRGLLGLRRWHWLLAIGALVAAAFVVVEIADNAVEDTLDTAADKGRAEAVAEGQRGVLEQVERAGNAETEIARGGDVGRYDRCLLNASEDTRANCERFRPLPD